ncbi:hypothetical protein [Synechococcus sp. HK01-R]|uniref:hypothetical protein n=1 Tax=Synechococcus sp. HK01-R TaxID=2751171 RepID=UPI001624E52E|nr:hypothetical protein [Synechococcus sp. HK01-R]QNG26982.1 hypothetical protein H0O21_12520 [Synechococcus sp. HK01-R]
MSRNDRFDDDRYENEHDDDHSSSGSSSSSDDLYEYSSSGSSSSSDDLYEYSSSGSSSSSDDLYEYSSSGSSTSSTSNGLYRLAEIRDYDGHLHGGSSDDRIESGYKYQGLFDVNNDGVYEKIYTNRYSGRWVTECEDPVTGIVDYGDYGQGGTTRVVGLYSDPLVEAGIVERGNTYDSQVRFQKDLSIDNLVVKTAGDYDGDGMQEVYWKTVDGTAYLRALMHADGNIQYANYQNEQQMTDYLVSTGNADIVSVVV